MKKVFSNIKFINIYTVLFAVSAVVFGFMMFLTDGMILEDIFHKGALGSDTFMDFFNSVRDGGSIDVYETGVIYPPLANIFFYLLAQMIKPELVATSYNDRLSLQNDIVCLVLYFTYVAVTVLIFNKTVKRKLDFDFDKSVSSVMAFLLTISYPMVYCFQRGNLIMLTATLTMFFVFNRNSANKVIRELSFIALAIAAGFKLYPAVFGLLLLFDGEFKRAFRLVLYGLAFVFIPFVFYGGFSAVELFLSNITSFSGKNSNNMVPGFVCIDAISHYITEIFNVSFEKVNGVLLVITYSLSVAVIVFSSREWQKCWGLSYLIMNYASFSRTYTLIFAIIPFVMFLSEKNKHRKDMIYLLCFAALFIVIPAVYYTQIDEIMSFLITNVFHANESLGNLYARTIVANPNRAAAPFLVSGMMLFMFADVMARILKKEQKLSDGLHLIFSENK